MLRVFGFGLGFGFKVFGFGLGFGAEGFEIWHTVLCLVFWILLRFLFLGLWDFS